EAGGSKRLIPRHETLPLSPYRLQAQSLLAVTETLKHLTVTLRPFLYWLAWMPFHAFFHKAISATGQ
ncbi:MAG: hypothetical protein ACRC8Q_04015, partial [Aeromonas sp.]